MDTLRISDKKEVKIIAHRGLSGIEKENTAAAFVAAGNRTYFGIESDVHVCKDGGFIIHHNDDIETNDGLYNIYNTDYDVLRNLTLKGNDQRNDHKVPCLCEYISICKKYSKIAVLEFKHVISEENIDKICKIIEDLDYLSGVVFISFDIENLIYLRSKYPNQKIQYLTCMYNEIIRDILNEYRLDLDINQGPLTKEVVDDVHSLGLEVNVWTVDEIEMAQKFINMGVDYITSNILE